jgi:hypothetical protein
MGIPIWWVFDPSMQAHAGSPPRSVILGFQRFLLFSFQGSGSPGFCEIPCCKGYPMLGCLNDKGSLMYLENCIEKWVNFRFA